MCLTFQNFLSPIDSFYLPLRIALLMGFGIVTYLVVKNLNLTPRTVEALLWVFSIAMMCNAVETWLSVQSPVGLMRYSGYSDSANTAGFNGGVALLILVGNQLSGKGTPLLRTVILPVSILLVGFAIVATQSRGALLASVIALLVIFSLSFARKSTRNTTVLVAVLIPGLLFFLLPVVDVDWNRLTYRLSRLDPGNGLSSRALSGREELWPAYYAMARDSNFLGVGFVQSVSKSGRYLQQLPNRNYQFEGVGAHSDYLLLFVETGLLGMTLYVFCLCLLIGNLLRRYRNSQIAYSGETGHRIRSKPAGSERSDAGG